jgi:hypothetical protein
VRAHRCTAFHLGRIIHWWWSVRSWCWFVRAFSYV